MPTYPFARERYWIPKSEEKATTITNGKLHPLLHSNESDLSEQKYQSVFTGSERFLSEHLVQGEKILPGVAHLELAREAGARSLHHPITQIRDVTWLNPVQTNGQPKQIRISLFEEKASIGYEIYSNEGDQETIHSQGKLNTQVLVQPSPVDISAIQNRLPNAKQGADCYELFKKIGFNHGNSYQGITKLYYSEGEALSRIRLPKDADYVLEPGMMDSALQTCIGLILEQATLSLPFSVKTVNIYGDVSQTKWCHVQKSKTGRTDDKFE